LEDHDARDVLGLRHRRHTELAAARADDAQADASTQGFSEPFTNATSGVPFPSHEGLAVKRAAPMSAA
jgi:hypothetical protein